MQIFSSELAVGEEMDRFVEVPVFQLVLLSKLHQSVLKVAHDEAGHFGVRKTYDCVLRHSFWPCMKKDVSAYIKICHTCQLTDKPNQILKPALLYPNSCSYAAI